MSKQNINVLLTGGNGFIGRNIYEYFETKYNVFAPTHLELDLLNEKQVNDYFQRYRFDVVIHSAVKPGHRNAQDPTNLFYSNTRMYFNLARQVHKYKQMIVLGSGAIYDTSHNILKVSEDSYKTCLPSDEHGFCKNICARDIECMDNIIELRLFGVFGKYEDYAIRFISNAICKTLFDLPITIKQNRKFDYLYIDDLMPILEYFIENESKHKAYNVTPDKSTALYQVANMVRDISGKDLPIIIHNPEIGSEYSGNNSRLRSEIRDIKFTPLSNAVNQLYKWYKDNIETIDRNCLLDDK